LIYLNAPPAMRSRMMGVLSVCIGTGPFGIAHVRLLASYLDEPTAVAIIGIEGAIALVLVCVAWPRLLSKVAT